MTTVFGIVLLYLHIIAKTEDPRLGANLPNDPFITIVNEHRRGLGYDASKENEMTLT